MSISAQRLSKARLTADDWKNAALKLIAEEGFNAVNVERLAKDMGVTKGSFYWHFGSRKELLKESLAHWEASDIATFERSIEIYKNPLDRLRALFRRTTREMHSHIIYSSLLAAGDHPLVNPVMARVSARRQDYLTQAFERLGMPHGEAQDHARLTYYSYVGFLQSTRHFRDERLRGEDLERYVQHVIDTLIPAASIPDALKTSPEAP